MHHSYRIKNIENNTYLHLDGYWHQLGEVNISPSSFHTEQAAEQMLLVEYTVNNYYSIEKIYYKFS